MQSIPKVSILIPHYNHGNLIGGALKSIQNQNFSDFEIIIVDDCSTDSSKEVLLSLAAEDKRIKLFFNEKNYGTEITLNRCIDYSSGEYIVCRAADDLFMPGFLEKSVSLMTEYPLAGMCAGDVEFFDDDNNSCGIESLAISENDRYFSPDEMIQLWKSDHNIPAASALYRRTDFLKAGTYLKGLRWNSDWMLNMIITFRTGMIYCPQIFSRFRLSSNSYGNSKLLDQEAQDDIYYHLLLYLKNDFQDILPAFMSSGALDLFAPKIVDTYFRHKDLWCIELLNALQKPIYTWNKRKESTHDNHGISKNVREVLAKNKTRLDELFANNKVTRIVTYGAGLHSEKLLRVWDEFNFPNINLFIVSGVPESSHFKSLPVFSVDKFVTNEPILILLSSQSFEDSMAETAKKHFPNAFILSFWKEKYTKL